MSYINPLLLLRITTVDPAEVRKAKNQQLAMLQLSEDDSLPYGDLSVDRSTLLFVCDQLKDDNKARFHLELFQEERLLQFLSFGKTTYFDQYQHRELWEESAFRRFIGPFYEVQFDRVYAQAFVQNDVYLLRKMLEQEHLLPPGTEEGLYRTSLRKAEEEKTQLRSYQQRISYSAKHALPATADAFKANLQAISLIEKWQALPDVFTPLRSEMAQLYSALIQRMYQLYPSDETVTEELIGTINQLKVSTQVRRQLQQQHQGFFASKEKRAKQQEQAKQQATKREEQAKRQETKRFLKQVEELIDLYQAGNLRTEVLLAGLNELYQGAKFQELKTVFSDFDRRQLGRKLRTLAVLLWEKEEDLTAVIELTTFAMELPVAEKPWPLFSEVNVKTPKNSIAKRTIAAVLVLDTLRSLVDKNRRFAGDKTHLLSWTGLIQQLFPEDVQQWLLRTGSFSLLAWTHEQLFPVLYFLRTIAPKATLQLVDKLHPLFHNDDVIGEKADQLRTAIATDLQQQEESQRKAKHIEALDGPWAKIQQLWREGQEKLDQFEGLQWIRIAAATIVGLIIIGYGYSFLFVQKQPPPIDWEPPPPPSVSEIEFEKQEFIVKRDSFLGNQLDNFAQAYPRCFGDGVYGNQGSLQIINRSAEDMIATVYLKDSLVIRHAYIQKGKQVRFTQLTRDTLGVKLYTGNDWNPIKPNFCGTNGAFDTKPRYWLLKRKLFPAQLIGGAVITISAEETVTLIDGETIPLATAFYPISAGGFFYIKPDWKRRRDGEIESPNRD